MKIKRVLLILPLIITGFICCSKDPVYPEGYSIIGRWNIVELDSGRMPDIPSSMYIMAATLSDTGTVVFNRDSTGHFVTPIRTMTGGIPDFIWSHDKLQGLIDFTLSNGTSFAWVQSQLQDSLDILFADYLERKYIGSRQYYHLKLVKQQ